MILQNFNPRSRVGNDESGECLFNTVVDFNPRSRVGNDLSICGGVSIVGGFQSTFPRGERPSANTPPFAALNISIHVPAWGTTNMDAIKIVLILNFNPRSRVGNDIVSLRLFGFRSISIHVPAWGTTEWGRYFPRPK